MGGSSALFRGFTEGDAIRYGNHVRTLSLAAGLIPLAGAVLFLGVLGPSVFADPPSTGEEPDVRRTGKNRPIKKRSSRKGARRFDRTQVVGAPVFDQTAREGVYLWLEDGWFRLAAVARTKQQFSISVSSSKPVDTSRLGDFKAKRRGKRFTAVARVTQGPANGRFKTEGEITVTGVRRDSPNRAIPLFVGPLGESAQGIVRIGRY